MAIHILLDVVNTTLSYSTYEERPGPESDIPGLRTVLPGCAQNAFTTIHPGGHFLLATTVVLAARGPDVSALSGLRTTPTRDEIHAAAQQRRVMRGRVVQAGHLSHIVLSFKTGSRAPDTVAN